MIAGPCFDTETIYTFTCKFFRIKSKPQPFSAITDKLLISGAKFDKALVDKIVRSLSECMLADNETVSPATMPAADGRGQWSQVVNGLQCRLMVDRGPGAEGQVVVDGVEKKVKLLGGEHLVLELRNAGKEPIYVPLWRDELPIVELSVCGCPGLRSPTTYGDATALPHLLGPGEVLRRQRFGFGNRHRKRAHLGAESGPTGVTV